MADDPRITAEYIRSRLAYDDATGILTWKPKVGTTVAERKWNGKCAGKPAGSVSKDRGHLETSIDCKKQKLHRLAWLHYYGEWPAGEVDHINGDPGDNRIANLRIATHAENMRNMKMKRTNSIGVKGVFFDRARNKYQARIKVGYKGIHLGRYDTIEEAAAAYARASEKYHGEFGRLA
jgi:hypothetical protein